MLTPTTSLRWQAHLAISTPWPASLLSLVHLVTTMAPPPGRDPRPTPIQLPRITESHSYRQSNWAPSSSQAPLAGSCGQQLPTGRYQPPAPGYNPPMANHQSPTPGYNSPMAIHQPPAPGYNPHMAIHQPTAPGYNPHMAIHQSSASGYNPLGAGLHPPMPGYQLPMAGYQGTLGYKHPMVGFLPPLADYQPPMTGPSNYQRRMTRKQSRKARYQTRAAGHQSSMAAQQIPMASVSGYNPPFAGSSSHNRGIAGRYSSIQSHQMPRIAESHSYSPISRSSNWQPGIYGPSSYPPGIASGSCPAPSRQLQRVTEVSNSQLSSPTVSFGRTSHGVARAGPSIQSPLRTPFTNMAVGHPVHSLAQVGNSDEDEHMPRLVDPNDSGMRTVLAGRREILEYNNEVSHGVNAYREEWMAIGTHVDGQTRYHYATPIFFQAFQAHNMPPGFDRVSINEAFEQFGRDGDQDEYIQRWIDETEDGYSDRTIVRKMWENLWVLEEGGEERQGPARVNVSLRRPRAAFYLVVLTVVRDCRFRQDLGRLRSGCQLRAGSRCPRHRLLSPCVVLSATSFIWSTVQVFCCLPYIGVFATSLFVVITLSLSAICLGTWAFVCVWFAVLLFGLGLYVWSCVYLWFALYVSVGPWVSVRLAYVLRWLVVSLAYTFRRLVIVRLPRVARWLFLRLAYALGRLIVGGAWVVWQLFVGAAFAVGRLFVAAVRVAGRLFVRMPCAARWLWWLFIVLACFVGRLSVSVACLLGRMFVRLPYAVGWSFARLPYAVGWSFVRAPYAVGWLLFILACAIRWLFVRLACALQRLFARMACSVRRSVF